MAAHDRKKSENIQNIFPEYLKLLQIFWIQNNIFFENTNFSTKIQDGCRYIKKLGKSVARNRICIPHTTHSIQGIFL